MATGRGRLAGLVVPVLITALLIGLIAWTVVALQPPRPQPAPAPAGQFSAARAAEHVQQIAVRTHVAGSAADADVVDYLVAALSSYGLDTRVQNSVGSYAALHGTTEMASVRNV